MPELLIYALIGVVAGASAGLFGIGGGLVVVPALLLAFQQQGVDPAIAPHLAVGTSLATVVITGSAAAWGHYRQGAVETPLLRRLLAGLVPGAAGGVALASALDGDVLQRLFAVFLLGAAIHAALDRGTRQGTGGQRLPAGIAGGGIGTVSTLVGIGGGTLTVPYLAWRGCAIHRAVGTAAATAPGIGIVGATGYIIGGWGQPGLPDAAAGYIHLGALAGIAATSPATSLASARLAHRIPARLLRRLFAAVLAAVALRLLLG